MNAICDIELYPHPGYTLLPLLRAHLPHSLSIYGTLLATSSSADEPGGRTLWATFPPSRIPVAPTRHASGVSNESHEDVWTVMIAYPPPEEHQTRVYSSLEHVPSKIGETETRAKYQVVSTIATYIKRVDPDMRYVGKVHEKWLDAVESILIGRGKRRGRYWIWVPPFGVGDDGVAWPVDTSIRTDQGGRERERQCGDENEETGLKESATMPGYEVRPGTEKDVQDFVAHTDIQRDASYYLSRLPYTTVIHPVAFPSLLPGQGPGGGSGSGSHFDELWTPRSETPSGTSSPSCDTPSSAKQLPQYEHQNEQLTAARILKHADGSLGALQTHPAHRRRGLARWIVSEHLGSGTGGIPDPGEVTLVCTKPKGKSKGEGQGQGEGEGEGSERLQQPSFGKGYRQRQWTYAVVYDGNTASEGLWEKMGWKKCWRSASVYRDMDMIMDLDPVMWTDGTGKELYVRDLGKAIRTAFGPHVQGRSL